MKVAFLIQYNEEGPLKIEEEGNGNPKGIIFFEKGFGVFYF